MLVTQARLEKAVIASRSGRLAWKGYHARFETLIARLFEKVRFGDEDDCWEWLGSRDTKGYGRISAFNKIVCAHRAMWCIHHGIIPDDLESNKLEICHHCDNKSCVNIDHLFVGSRSNNMLDAALKKRLWMQNRKPLPVGLTKVNAEKTHCLRGHPLFGDNVKFVGKRKMRRCVTCFRMRDREDKRQARLRRKYAHLSE